MKIVVNKYTLLGGVLVFFILGAYLVLMVTGLTFKNQAVSTPRAALTVLPAGMIPTQDLSLLVVTPTLTPQFEPTDQYGIGIGKNVQISGTGGVGLRIREGAGRDFNTHFLANESEVFKVINGPVEADNITWYQLVAPYDENRQGWASAEYLVKIEGQ
jgi:hypothetical protein